jgi:hypothetical protein
MSYDVFSNIKRPEEFVEIGQPTYVELIYAKTCVTSPAIRKQFPTPNASLKRIAFGKSCVTSTEENITQQPAVSQLKLSKGTQKSKQQIKPNISNEFNNIISNIYISSVAQCDDGYRLISFEAHENDSSYSDTYRGRWNGARIPNGTAPRIITDNNTAQFVVDKVRKWLWITPKRDNNLGIGSSTTANTINISLYNWNDDRLTYGSKLKLSFEVVDYVSYFNHRTNLQVKFWSPFTTDGQPILDVILDSEPGVKEVEITIPGIVGDPNEPQPFADIRIEIINIGNLSGLEHSDTVPLKNITICVKDVNPPPCISTVTGLKVSLEHNGIPRNPINVFGCITKFTIRNPQSQVSEEIYLPVSENRSSKITCDFWKSQRGSGEVLRKYYSNINDIIGNSIVSIDQPFRDWLWSIPQKNNSTTRDLMTASVGVRPGGETLTVYYVESVEVLLLINSITPADTTPTYPSPLGCGPDPSDGLNVSIQYTNRNNLEKKFTFKISNFYTETDSTGIKWDTDYKIGTGIQGSMARWESVLFKLDTIDGTGLDQCTEPSTPVSGGLGNLSIINPKVVGNGYYSNPCKADIIIEDIASEAPVNEIQSIEMPKTTGGTWDLSFTRNGVTRTTTLPWNADAARIKSALVELPNINTPNNIKVTGSGSTSNPFLIEFTGDLAGMDHSPLVADGSNLVNTGASGGNIETIQNGTKNEIQRIRNEGRESDYDSIRISQSIDLQGGRFIPYPISLNRLQSALEELIWEGRTGVGNISVTPGPNQFVDRNVPYAGPYFIEFINGLSNTNVSQIDVLPRWPQTDLGRPSGFSVSTIADGLIGRDEIQRIWGTPGATDGVFDIRIFNQDRSAYFDVNDIPYNVSAAAFKNLIVSSTGSFITSEDIIVRVVDYTPQPPAVDRNAWDITFTGQYAGVDMPQIERRSESGALPIIVREVRKGSGANDRQRIRIVRAGGGSFKLTIIISGVGYTTSPIPWDVTAEGLQER